MIYKLGNTEFKNKDKILRYFKDILKNNEVGTILKGESREIMRDLVKWHPEYEEKWGDEFKIFLGAYKEKQFRVCDDDGVWWVFSYVKCINKPNKEKNHRKNVIDACRSAIDGQKNKFLQSKQLKDGKWICEISRNKYHRDEIHVDHNFESITFQTLLDNFLNERNLKYSDIGLIDETYGGSILSDEYRELWQEYHKNKAKLRIIHKTYNLRGKLEI